MDIYGVPDIGHILTTDIFGCREYGYSLHVMVICGRHPGGVMKPASMDFTQDTGVLTSVTMGASTMGMDIMDQVSLVADGKEIISDIIRLS
jgi:hypothetical protein